MNATTTSAALEYACARCGVTDKTVSDGGLHPNSAWCIEALRADLATARGELAEAQKTIRVMQALSGERVEYVPTYTTSDTAARTPDAQAVTEALETWMSKHLDSGGEDGWIMYTNGQFVARSYEHEDVVAPTLAALVAALAARGGGE